MRPSIPTNLLGRNGLLGPGASMTRSKSASLISRSESKVINRTSHLHEAGGKAAGLRRFQRIGLEAPDQLDSKGFGGAGIVLQKKGEAAE